jgi:hypothetical protein
MYEPGAHDELIARRMPVMRVIVAALVSGVLVFVGIVHFGELGPAVPLAPLPQVGLPVMTTSAAVFFLMAVMMAFVIPAVMTRTARRQVARNTSLMPGASDAEKLLNVYQSRTILGCAFLEGAGFFGTVAAMLEGHWAGMAVAGAAVALMVVLFFPTHGRVASWLATQLDALAQERGTDNYAGGR